MRALVGCQNVFGPDHHDCQAIEEKLSALQVSHSATPSTRTSLDALRTTQPAPSTAISMVRVSGRRRVLQKLGLK
jgi:hypothetical protein